MPLLVRPRGSLVCTLLGALACGGSTEPRKTQGSGPGPAASVEIVVPGAPIAVGDSAQLRAIVRDAEGREVPNAPVHWQSYAVEYFTVNATTGVVRAVGEGRGNVAVILGAAGAGIADVKPLVTERRARRIQVDFVPESLEVSVRYVPRLTVYDGLGQRLDRPVTLSSSDTSVLQLSDQGGGRIAVNGVLPGAATLLATADDYTERLPRRIVPAWVHTVHQFTAIASGNQINCGLEVDGSAYCWGRDESGQLGDGAGGVHPEGVDGPVPVAGGLRFTQLDAGGSSVCGVTASNELYCWGSNFSGQLGLGRSSPAVIAPTRAMAGIPVRQVALSEDATTCAVATDGTPYCFGANPFFGTGHASPSGGLSKDTAVAPVDGGMRFASVAVTYHHSCGLTDAGAAYCWGRNSLQQLGQSNASLPTSVTPVPVSGGLLFSAIVPTEFATCGLQRGTGAAYCWGGNNASALGRGVTTLGLSDPTPQPVVGGLTFRTLVGGEDHVCGITPADELYCWGTNFNRAMGRSQSEISVPSPVELWPGTRFRAVSAGLYSTCGVSLAGTTYCVGRWKP